MKIYPSQTVVISGGGTPGNVTVGPDYGNPPEPKLNVLPALSAIALGAQKSIGVSPTLSALAWAAQNGIGVSPVMANVGLGAAKGIGIGAVMGAIALGAVNGIGVGATVPNVALNMSQGIAGHFTGSLLGAPSYQSVNSVNSTAAGTSVVIPAPAGIVVGDLLVAFNGSNNATTTTLPSGWTLIKNTQRSGTLACTLNSSWKIADAADAAAANFTFTVGASGAFFGSMHRISAINSATPINVSSEGTGSAVSPIAPTATTTAANCLIFLACVQNSAVGLTYTAPAGYTERTDQDGVGVASAHLLDGATDTKVQAVAGATGDQTMTSTALVSTDYAAQTVVIAPGTLIIGI